MNYLVYTPFRCGSSFLTRLIRQNLKSAPLFIRDIKSEQSAESMIIKGHGENIDLLKNIQINHIFTSIRKPTDIFISAFIKDCKKIGYSYYFEKDVSEENLQEMIDHFLTFSWEDFNWLSYDFNFSQIERLTGIDLWNEDFNKNHGYSLYKHDNGFLLVVTHKKLFTDFDSIKPLLGSVFEFNNLNMSNFSFRNSDVYGDLYKKFIDKIPLSFYEKYKYLDDKIVNKFIY
jgi:hypothetical protein